MPEIRLTPTAVAVLLRRHTREAEQLAARVGDPAFEGNSFDSALIAGRLRELSRSLHELSLDADKFALDEASRQA
ncbi:MAG: hypothetical protein ABSG54_17900 [Terriglobia bacterium]|jgi:hypothetical protein